MLRTYLRLGNRTRVPSNLAYFHAGGLDFRQDQGSDLCKSHQMPHIAALGLECLGTECCQKVARFES